MVNFFYGTRPPAFDALSRVAGGGGPVAEALAGMPLLRSVHTDGVSCLAAAGRAAGAAVLASGCVLGRLFVCCFPKL
jgi:hypothetical protein